MKTSKTQDGGYQPLRICFERILPQELDTGRGTRHAIRDLLARDRHGKSFKSLSSGPRHDVMRMALVISKKWAPGTVLKCRFLDGSPKMRAKVQKMAHKWEQYEAIKLKFGDDADAQIRISFYADAGSWSGVGTDVLNKSYFPAGKPTMNFGWLRDDTDDGEYERVVVHEFGHALGCIHEHESPKFTRKWNKAAVYKAFGGPPNNWSKADIDSNVLDKYSPKGISATEFDPKSIMLYAFAAELFSDGLGPTNENKTLSSMDKKKIREMYPKK